MYADDHRPPHFHIIGPDFQVVVAIEDLNVIAGRGRRSQIAAALTWAAQNRAMLADKWRELVERD